MKKLRVVRFHVQPEIVSDENDILTALPIQPITIDAKDWSIFIENGFNKMLSDLENQFNK